MIVSYSSDVYYAATKDMSLFGIRSEEEKYNKIANHIFKVEAVRGRCL